MHVLASDSDQIAMTFDRYGDMIYRIAWQYTQNAHDAEDILQEVLVRYIKSQPAFCDEEHKKAWLIRVTVNLCRDRSRFLRIRKIVSFEDIQEPVMDADTSVELLDLVMHLPPKDRIVLYLYYYESYTIPEIANILNAKQNTVSSRSSRARAKLKLIIEEGERAYEGSEIC